MSPLLNSVLAPVHAAPDCLEMNMVSDEIPLDEAPEHFFDQQKWSEFVDCFDNRQAALQQITRPEPGIIGFYRRQIANSAGPTTAKAQREEHT